MGASAQPQAPPAGPGREDVMLDDIQKNLDAQKVADKKAADEAEAKAKARLEAEARAAAAAAAPPDAAANALREALRISEESRKRTEDLLRSVAGKKEEPPPEMTREQLNELYSKDPLAAIEMMVTKSNKVLMDNVAQRLEPLVSGGATSAKEMARSKYPDEFQALGSEIEKMLGDPRVNKSAMGQLQAWEDLIFYVRGQPGNIEKLIEFRASRDKEKNAKVAQDAQAAAAGAHARSDVRPPPPTGGNALDATEQEIARAIFADKDPDEAYAAYTAYRGVGR